VIRRGRARLGRRNRVAERPAPPVSRWQRPGSLDVGIFAVSLAILLLELLLTRVFSVVMYHHFSFLAVSLAMMGIALGGLLVTLRSDRFRADNVATVGPRLALMFALSVIVAASVVFHVPVRLDTTTRNAIKVGLILLASVVPFVFGGAIVAHILAYNAERAHRLYFFDLVGAGFGCLAFVPLIGLVGAPTALLITAAIGTLGGVALATGFEPRVRQAMLAALFLLVAGLNAGSGLLDVRFARGTWAPPTLVTRWNSFSRVDVRGDRDSMTVERPPLGSGFSSRLRTTARELRLVYDGDALTQIVGFDGNLAGVEYLLWDVTAAAHHVRPNPDVLVIGAGGGRDLLAALAGGSRSVTGVEINGVTVDLMRGQFRDFTGGLYVDRPGVRVFTGDGRSFVQRTRDRYDLITASLVDTWAASSAGAYALAENSLYTVEAFADYLARLKPDGIVSFSRWYGDPPVEVFRVVSLARAALQDMGVAEPNRHVAVLRTDARRTGHPSLATILVKRSPFTNAELRRLRTWSTDMLFDVAYLPPLAEVRGSEPAFERLLGTGAEAARFVSTARADLSPTTDDRPFFFDRVPLMAWLGRQIGFPAPSYASEKLPLASWILLSALIATVAGTLLLLALPLIAGRRRTAVPRQAGVRLRTRLGWIAYFGVLGLGYIVVEIVLIQRFNLYLGSPAYALTVVLFTMLLASGMGGSVSERWHKRRAILAMLLAICLALAVGAATVSRLIYGTIAAPTPVRIALAVAFVAPIGFVMGMPFPTGLRAAGRTSQSLVPWAWAVNGATSVLGSVLAVIVSMSVGFSASLLVGLSAYLTALGIAAALVRSAPRLGTS
jgi:SAM-dependent methyltransferase